MHKIDTVHVVFKTHLDIGFTDLAENVTKEYMNNFIPKAIDLAERLSKKEGPENFLWTTGSWLIYEYLKTADSIQLKKMEEAIVKGHVTWHGLPFTTHTELMDVRLFEFGLSIADKLDKRFEKKTIAAKMTDVPGHTMAIVSHMAKQGLKYLHIGVNPASKKPNVPNLFVWKDKEGAELIVNYADSYGEVLEVEGLADALVFAHTGDNCGPPSDELIKEEFMKLKKRFPNAVIKASTLDAFAEQLLKVKNKLPIIYEEVGDTWIHGIATDPKKVSYYRELLRLRDKWIKEGKMDIKSQEYEEFSVNLLLVVEHTWGLDLKKHLMDYINYSAEDFQRARKVNTILPEYIPEKYRYIGNFALDEFDMYSKQLFSKSENERSYSAFERSWKEQRDYICKAIDALSEDKKKEAEIALEKLEYKAQEFDKVEKIKAGEVYKLGKFKVKFREDGAIIKLIDKNKKEWANDNHAIGYFRYESFGTENYDHWFETYMENLEETGKWADSDFRKPGMEYANPKPINQLYQPNLCKLKLIRNDEYDLVIAQLKMDDSPVEVLGAPRDIIIKYKFYLNKPSINMELYWFNKNPCRLPEATWISFTPQVEEVDLWKMDKMGQSISPLEVIEDGNRNLHAIDKGVYYDGPDGKVMIETLDAPLLSPGERRILKFDNTLPSLGGGMHFNLNNNIWGTNFPMWYEDDASFRFSITLIS